MADDRYISPIPAEVITDYRVRVAGAAQQRRVHQFRANGGAISCEPARCRECWREQHWRAGQTHGGADV